MYKGLVKAREGNVTELSTYVRTRLDALDIGILGVQCTYYTYISCVSGGVK